MSLLNYFAECYNETPHLLMALKTLRQLKFRESFHKHDLWLVQMTSLMIMLGETFSFHWKQK